MKKHAAKRWIVSAGVSAAVALAIAAPASAHHSGVGYDMSTTLRRRPRSRISLGCAAFGGGIRHQGQGWQAQDVKRCSTRPAMLVRQGFSSRIQIGTRWQILASGKSGVLGGHWRA